MIRTPKQIASLASPLRITLVDTLEAIGPCSIADLARAVDARPDALYYHLRILEKSGVVRREGTIVQTTIPLDLVYDASDYRNTQAVTRVVSAILRGALRAFRKGFTRSVRTSGPRRELWAAQRTARLSAGELEAVNRLLDELLETFGARRHAESDDRLYSVTFVLTPQ